MDSVYIDTSVFISENFLEGKRIREIFRLSYEGHLQVILPEITYNEILNRIEKNISEALNGYKAFRDKVKILRNITGLENRFDIINLNESVENLQKKFSDRISSIGTIIIPYPTFNIRTVFEKYFRSELPFNMGEKKNEFPDAFALATLELWCEEKSKKCIVIAGDKDISGYKSKNLKVVASLGDYLDEKLRKISIELKKQKRIDIASKLYEQNKKQSEKDIEDWLIEELTQESTYQKYHLMEIQHVDINSTNVELGDFQVASINDHSIILTAYASVSVDVTIQLSDSSLDFYDNQNDNWHSFAEHEEKIEKQKRVPVSFEVDIPLAGDEYMDIKVLEINNGKDLNIY